MPTSDKNFRVVLKVRLICQDEIVYKDIIFCKTSLSVKVNCTFLQKITRLAQNLPKAKINSSIKKRLSLWDFSRFTLIKLRQQKWRKCFQNVQTLTTKDCKGPQTNMPKNVGSIKTWSAKMKSRCSILLSEFNMSKCSLKTNKALWGVTLNLIYSYYISLKNITKRSPKDLSTDAVNWWNLHRGSWSETSCFSPNSSGYASWWVTF